MAPLRYAAKFDPFLSMDCARVEGGGSNFAIWQPCRDRDGGKDKGRGKDRRDSSEEGSSSD